MSERLRRQNIGVAGGLGKNVVSGMQGGGRWLDGAIFMKWRMEVDVA